MGIVSIVLGVLAMILTVAGVFLTPVPYLGALVSFGSPLLALIGIVLGGVSLSRAKDETGETGVPMAGLIVSIVAFFPALFVALTCGVCNSMCSTSNLGSPSGSQGAPAWWEDGGNVPSPGLGPVPTPVPIAPVPIAPVPIAPVPAPMPGPNGPGPNGPGPDDTANGPGTDPAGADPGAARPNPDEPPPAFPPPPPP